MAPGSLRPYQHDPITFADGLRIIKLRPAEEGQEAIDCEVTETSLAATRHDQKNTYLDYEAVSWYWGEPPFDGKTLRVHKNGHVYALPIPTTLDEALRAFRHRDQERLMWIDAVCIDQGKIEERNSQVSKMNRIYAHAKRVCIWVGSANDTSSLALDFINNHVLNLWNYDELCKNTKHDMNWSYMKELLTRPWFSRRWVVQEVALSQEARLYCGKDWIDWQDFAVAVSLFVESEANSGKISDIMKASKNSKAIPEFFGEVRAMGAAELVEATGNIFRFSRNSERHPMRSLEYLISKYTVFHASQPRDVIYSFLSVAKDTVPRVAGPYSEVPGFSPTERQRKALNKLRRWWSESTATKPYTVAYDSSTVEVYKDYVLFAIGQSLKFDPSAALDILCRPWAPRFTREDEEAGLMEMINGQPIFKLPSKKNKPRKKEDLVPLPSWMSDLDGSAFTLTENGVAGARMRRRNADPLVGLPAHGVRNYRAAGTRSLDKEKFRFVHFKIEKNEAYSLFVEGFILDEISSLSEIAREGLLPMKWIEEIEWTPGDSPIPDDFWRLLVADRGPHGTNPPKFYARACEESFKRMVYSGSLNTQVIVNEEQSAIIADTLRRIQAVTWNRRLLKTATTPPRIGLAPEAAETHDFICIFYGCSVPVVLRRFVKAEEQWNAEDTFLREQANKRRSDAVHVMQANFRERLKRKEMQRAPYATTMSDSQKRSHKSALLTATAKHNKIADVFTQESNASEVVIQKPRPKNKSRRKSRSSMRSEDDRSVVNGHNIDLSVQKVSPDNLKSELSHSLSSEHWQALGDPILILQIFLQLLSHSYILIRLDWTTGAFLGGFLSYAALRSQLFDGNSENLIALLSSLHMAMAFCQLCMVFSRSVNQQDISLFLVIFLTCFWRQTLGALIVLGQNYSQHGKLPERKDFKKLYCDAIIRLNSGFAKTTEYQLDTSRDPGTSISPNGHLIPSIVFEERPAPKSPAPPKPAVYQRSSKYYYKVIGACYLHGMMDGEAILWQNENVIKKDMFELR